MRRLLLLMLLFPYLGMAQYSDTTTCISGMDQLTYAVHYDQQKCEDSCSGSYDIEVLSGSGSYLYSVLGNGGFSSVNAQENFLCVDDYTCIVTDQITGISCTMQFSVDSLLPLSHSIATTNCTATGACDGTAELTLSGGLPPYYVTWYYSNQQPIPNEDSTFIDSLCAGNYFYSVNTSYQSCCDTCTVTACDTCFPYGGTGGLIPFTINEPLGVVLDWTLDEQCEMMCDGEASVSAFGGSGNYIYTLGGYPPQNTGYFYGLCPGQYTVNVDDGGGNIGSVTFEIYPALPTFVDVQTTNEICANACDGTIQMTDLGGTVAGYSIDGGVLFYPTGYFDNLCPGNYDLFVETYNGCYVPIGIYTIGAGVSPVINSVQVTDETSQGANDGCIVGINASGGSTPYTYEVDGMPVWSFPHCGLAPGTHQVCVIDNNGCEACTTITIGAGCGLQVTESVSATCAGTCSGVVSVNVSGYTGGYTVLWTDSLGSAVGISDVVDNLCPGAYNFTVVDSLGCTDSGTLVVEELPGPQVTYNTAVQGCNYPCNGVLNVTGSGQNDFVYSLDGTSWTSQGNFNGLCAGFDTLYVMDTNGCIASYPFEIDTVNPLHVTTTVLTGTATSQNCTGKISSSASGGMPPYEYSWSICEGGDPVSTSGIASNLCPGIYRVTVTDGLGCSVVSECDTIKDVLSLQEVEGIEWSVHPNPVEGYFTISTTTKAPYALTIYAANGTLVFQATEVHGTFTGNAQELSMARGVYLVEIKSEGATDRKRVVVQ